MQINISIVLAPPYPASCIRHCLGRRGVSSVSQWRLRDLLLHENLLLILFIHLLELMISDGHDLCQFILYMHAMMMQHLAFWQKQLLK